jgi:coproporphyrinogen III oxidase-like Fe-S oxidoreductase
VSRWWNARDYSGWIDRVKQARSPIVEEERLDAENIRAERVYLGLRTDRGLSATEQELESARQWARAGWATIDDGVIRLTEEGWLRLDSLAAQLTLL